MRVRILVAALALLLGAAPWLITPTLVPAQVVACPGITTPLTAYSSEQVTVSSTAVALSSSAYMSGGRPPLMAIANVKDYPVVYDDAAVPTATVGTTAHATAILVICGQSIGRVQFIREGASDARLFIRYYRGP